MPANRLTRLSHLLPRESPKSFARGQQILAYGFTATPFSAGCATRDSYPLCEE